MTLFALALLLIAIIGFLAETTGLCMVKGVDEAVAGRPLFLLATLLSGAFAWVSILIAHLMEIPSPFLSFHVSALALAGGVLFGLGSAFNNGCGVSTISKLAHGQVGMLATVMGWLIGAVLLATFMLDQHVPRFYIANEWHYGGLFILSMLILGFVFRLKSTDRTLWLSMLSMGLMASIVYLFEPHWAPNGLINDISLTLLDRENYGWPSADRFMLVASLLIGMAVATLWKKSFKLEKPGLRALLRHLLAGTLMGAGAAIASGGNVTHLLISLPALSPAGGVTIMSMLFGIYIGRLTKI